MTGLSRHVPELAIEWMLDAPQERARVLDGSLCFADISGFTALAERLARRGRIGGEELVETLSRVFATMLDVAHERGGMLLKFGGDALLLFFDGEDHAVRAASTAVEMRSSLARAARAPTSVGPLALSMSVGVHSGDVHFFLVGSTHRELVLLGPSVTTVIETEGEAASGQILVSPETAALLPSSATRPREHGRALLRWRRPYGSLTGPRVERAAPAHVVHRLFPRNLAKHLADSAPDPEHRVACIAFIRFAGTDHMLAARGIGEVAAALDETVGAVQQAIESEGVSLLAIDIDRDGGKFFLGSGVPSASEDDEGAMLRALRRIIGLSLPLPLQCGVNRGHVFAAEVGTARRAAYSAMGDTTNTAARITSKAPSGSIYAHPTVLDQSLTRFAVTPAGPFTLKGKKAPLLVHDVGEELGRRRREGLEADVFVGRVAELAAMRDALAGSPGRECVLAVAGAPGVGKSRLLREALAGIPARRVLSVRGEPYAATSAFRMFRDPIRAVLGIVPGTQDDMAKQLHALRARLAPDLQPLLPLVADVAHIELEPTHASKDIQPNFRGERRAAILVALLEAIHGRELIFAIDDAQWADEASSELLRALERACVDRWPMIIVRRDQSGGFEPQTARTLHLAPLDADAMRALIDIATEAAPLRSHDVAEVIRRAGGNPLFAMEILRAVREVGSLDAVPETLEAAIASQIDALDPAARTVLRFATVLGRSFSRTMLEALLAAEGRADTLAAIDRLGEFLEAEGESRFRFRNGLLRDTIYEGLSFRLRTRLHRTAGETMEKLAHGPATNADELALHFSRADDLERTWRYSRIAAERARESHANADAARLYELAITASRRLPGVPREDTMKLWTDLGGVREQSGHFDGSVEAYRRALGVAGDEPLARAELLLGRAAAKERAGAFSASLRDLTSALSLIERAAPGPTADKVRARLLSFRAVVLWGKDRPRQALAQAQRAVEAARAADEKVSLGIALMIIDVATLALEGPGDGRHLKEALAIFEALGDLRRQATVRTNLGLLAAHAGRWNDAVEWMQSSHALYERSGDATSGAYAGINIGEILVNQRRFDEAYATLTAAMRVMRASAIGEMVAMIEIQLGRILIARGELTRAEALLEHTVTELTRLGKTTAALEASVVLADARLHDGRAADAIALVDEASRAAGKDGELMKSKVALIRGRALATLGEAIDARKAFDVGIEAAKQQHLPYEEALLRAARSDLDLASTHSPDTEDLQLASSIFERLGVRLPANA
jgi:class 3 adenylate cyclase/tetratricopeptide (TPR) repeat protein